MAGTTAKASTPTSRNAPVVDKSVQSFDVYFNYPVEDPRNEFFKGLLLSGVLEYRAAPRKLKSFVVSEIVNKVRSHHGRFIPNLLADRKPHYASDMEAPRKALAILERPENSLFQQAIAKQPKLMSVLGKLSRGEWQIVEERM